MNKIILFFPLNFSFFMQNHFLQNNQSIEEWEVIKKCDLK